MQACKLTIPPDKINLFLVHPEVIKRVREKGLGTLTDDLSFRMRSPTTNDRAEELRCRPGAAVTPEGRGYFNGAVPAVLYGWREITVDVDLKPNFSLPGSSRA